MAGTRAAGTERRRPGRTGPGLLLIGGLLVLASLTVLTWYTALAGPDSAGDSDFRRLRTDADALGGVPVAAAYFDRLAWVLLIAVAVVGLAAALPSRASNALRVLGFLLGVTGAGVTYYALAQLFHAQGTAGATSSGVWRGSTVGMWAALGGFLLAALGAGTGPGRATA